MALVNKPDESIFASSAKQGEVDNFPDLLRGWGISFEQTGGIPPMEWFNFLFKRLDEKHSYLMQRGLPEWSATQDYPAGAFVQHQGLSYKALRTNKNVSPSASNSADWQRWGFTLTEIAKASLTQQGIVQLTNALNSDAENLALTAKAGKALEQQIVQVKQEIVRDYIPNSKKSSVVNSNSADTVATSAAVKTANDNANDRVSKSGDVMTGTLTIENNEPRVHGKKAGIHKWFIGLPNANTDYPRFHNYANDTWMELNSGNIIVNKPLYLGNNPLPSSLNGHHVQFRWNNNALELKVDNSELGYLHTSMKAYAETNVVDNNYSGLNIIRKGTSGNFWARFEALPDRRWKFSTENGSTIHLKNQSGNILLDSDISHAINGTNKAKVASEFALGELNKTKANLADFSYQKIGNFEIRKYPDGTMIQTYAVEIANKNTQKWSEHFNWAVAFASTPTVIPILAGITDDTNATDTYILYNKTLSSNTKCVYHTHEYSWHGTKLLAEFTAIGRWK